jgi:hypothetical protein
MSRIEESIEVGVPVRVAYDQWTQFEEFPRFMDGVDEVRQIDDTHLHWRASVAGVQREWDAEITHQEPDRRICWRAVEGHRNDGEVRFEPMDGDRTRVILEMEHEPEGTVDKVGDWLGLAKRRAKADLERFRELIESHGTPTGAWRGEVRDGETTGGGPSAGAAAAAGPITSMDDPATGAAGMDPVGYGTAGAAGATGYGDMTSGRSADRDALDRPMMGDVDPGTERAMGTGHETSGGARRDLDPAGERMRGDAREDLTEGPTPETRAAIEMTEDDAPRMRRDLTDGPTPETRDAVDRTDGERDRDDDPEFRDSRRGI